MNSFKYLCTNILYKELLKTELLHNKDYCNQRTLMKLTSVYSFQY